MKRLLSLVLSAVIFASSFCTVASAYAAGSPQSTSITSVKAREKGFTVKWKKKSKISGYQIQYSTSSKFKNAKSVKIKKAKTTSKKITGLKAPKKYYVRIRTYKNKKYSKWSKKKSVITKADTAVYTDENSKIDPSLVSLDYIECTDGSLVVLVTNGNNDNITVSAQVVFTSADGTMLKSSTAEIYCLAPNKTSADIISAPTDSSYNKITDYSYYATTVKAEKTNNSDYTDYVSAEVTQINEGKCFITFKNNSSPKEIEFVRYVAIGYDSNGYAAHADYSYADVSKSGMVDVESVSMYDESYKNFTASRVDVYYEAYTWNLTL